MGGEIFAVFILACAVLMVGCLAFFNCMKDRKQHDRQFKVQLASAIMSFDKDKGEKMLVDLAASSETSSSKQ